MVASNDRLAVVEAANYLESLGHRRIGYIAGPVGHRSAIERREGFIGALAAARRHGAGRNDRRGRLHLRVRPRVRRETAAAVAAPTAIFASNDEMAAGVYRAAGNMGLSIPRDLSVVGFDDGPSRLACCPH